MAAVDWTTLTSRQRRRYVSSQPWTLLRMFCFASIIPFSSHSLRFHICYHLSYYEDLIPPIEVVEKGWTLVNSQAQGCSGLNNLTSTTGTQRGLRGISSMAYNDEFTTTVAANTTNDASESGLTDEYETTNDLLMFMTVFFVVLIVLFIGFCAYYMQFNCRTRQRQRSANQVRCLFRLNKSGCVCYKYLYSQCL